MNMSTTKRYQDILQELSKTPREDVVKFRNKYEEALNEFLELKEVYTIASKKSSLEEIKNNKYNCLQRMAACFNYVL